MKPKFHGFKEGVLLETLRSMGGEHLKGSTVRYKKYKTIQDKDKWTYSDHEYHVVNLDNMELIRTTKLKIEGVELPDLRQEYLNKKKQNG